MREEFMMKLKTYVKYRIEKRTLIGALYNTENNFIFGRDDGTPFPKSTLYNAYKATMEHISHVTRKMENKSIEKFDEYMQNKSAK